MEQSLFQECRAVYWRELLDEGRARRSSSAYSSSAPKPTSRERQRAARIASSQVQLFGAKRCVSE